MSTVHLDQEEDNMSRLLAEENQSEQTAPAGHRSSVLIFLPASWGALTLLCWVCLTTYHTPDTGIYLLVFTGYSENVRAIDAGPIITSPKFNSFLLRLPSWGHVTYLGSVFFWINGRKWVNKPQQLMCCSQIVCPNNYQFICAFCVCVGGIPEKPGPLLLSKKTD